MSLKKETFEEYEMIAMLVRMVDEKDSFTSGHSERVAVYASRIASEMGLSEEYQYTLYRAGLLHDIGKIVTPESVLLKPATLTNEEYFLIKEHSQMGSTLIEMVSSLRPLKELILYHHERYDGKGYPAGLKGEKIPLLSRILSVSDAFDAMTTNRVYRSKRSIKEAINILQEEKGKQFDPQVVDAAIKIFKKFEKFNFAELDIIKDKKMEKRIAHFFKDPLTQAYNNNFLKHYIIKHSHTNSYECLYFVEILGMHRYNKRNGWEAGDLILKTISKKLHELFPQSLIFRVHGDDFIVLNEKHVEYMNKTECLKHLSKTTEELEICVWHHSLEKYDIENEEELYEIIYPKYTSSKKTRLQSKQI